MALWPFHQRLGKVPFAGVFTLGEAIVLLALLGIAAGWAAGSWPTVGSGNVAVAYLIGAYILAMRNSPVTFLLGLSHERGIAWHGLAAVLATGLALYHGLIEQLDAGKDEGDGASADQGDEEGEDDGRDPYHLITGWVGFGLMAALVLTSASRRLLRAYAFNTWQALHVTMLIACFVVVAIHSAVAVLVGAGAWALDVAVRQIYMARMRNPRTVEIVALPADVVRISWPAENFQYAGGQYVFLNIPELSWAEYHPFSLSSAPGSAEVHLHIRVLGDWTRKLHTRAMQGNAALAPNTWITKAYIEGPFGSPSIDLYGSRYKAFLLISGGIGVTPVQSFFNHLMDQRKRGRPVRLAHLVWSVRDRAMVSNILGYDEVYANTKLPRQLPVSFQPDLISPHIFVRPRSAGGGDGKVSPAPLQMLPVQSRPGSAGGVATPGSVVLEEARGDDHITTEFYLTQAREQGRDKANISPELQPALRLGRPNIPEIVADTAKQAAALGETRVAVFVCGPAAMVAEVQAVAAAASGCCGRGGEAGVAFDVHAEVFEF
ncbi:hypothetical protein HYH03_017639 [Edaphochlamys debaryana]|uniref:FAD-binding FR-type domain-containing protein n=1 Tax=Edaphochlamys debaryana TaxID=47281 RepID=A0A836BNZ7_9CHLO|nr:hypothetical protein HYH03_017639 [Edaphochlamys debaryana]|eukprot:KAG2483535.1 hypothetical protein HYH03_017639 [Edaphochlamys debaryana]